MQEKNILFALLHAEFSDADPNDLPSSLTEEEAAALYSLSHRHDISQIVTRALSRHQLLGCGRAFDDFRQAMAEAAYWHEQFRFELSEICRVLNEAGIPHIPLKGSVIRKLYPEPWMRTSCDIDLLVRQEHLKKAIDALTLTLHYSVSEKENYHDISLYSKSGLHLELHFSLRENMSAADTLLERVWEYSAPQSDGSMTFYQSAEHLYFHVIAHAAYHFRSGGCGIRPLIDLYLMQKNLPVNGEILDSLLKEGELDLFYSGICALICVWLEGQPHTKLTEKTEDYILSGGTYGTRKNHEVMLYQEAGSDSRYIFKRIFMPYNKMKIKYPILNKHRFLTPFFHVVRWCGLLRAKKFPRRLMELKRVRGVDNEAKTNAGDLLKELGL